MNLITKIAIFLLVLTNVNFVFANKSGKVIREETVRVDIKFLNVDLNYALKKTEYRMLKISCPKFSRPLKKKNWNCSMSSNGGYKCHNYYACDQGVSFADIKKIKTQIKKHLKKFSKQKGKVKIKLTMVESIPEKQQKFVSSKNITQKNQLAKRFTLNNLILASTVVWDEYDSSLVTTHLAVEPKFNLNSMWSINGKIGGHYLASESEKSILVLEYGLFGEYLMGQYSAKFGGGTQVWNQDELSGADFVGVGGSYYPKKMWLRFINELKLSFNRLLGSKTISDIRLGVGLSF